MKDFYHSHCGLCKLFALSSLILFTASASCGLALASNESGFNGSTESFAYAVLGDRVWNDVNMNGVQNTGEVGVAGVTVSLEAFSGPASPTSADLANPAYWSVTATTTTNAVGIYSFTLSSVGYHRIKFGLPAGFQFTQANQGPFPNDSNVDDAGYSEAILVMDGWINNTIDAGVFASLPVRLADFQVSVTEDKSALLKWTITEESGSSYFGIEKSVNGRNWTEIGQVAAKGNYIGTSTYTYLDTLTLTTPQYYRLKMVDQDQSYAYSSIASFTSSGQEAVGIRAYPNPASEKLFLHSPANIRVSSVTITDMTGRLLITADATDVETGIGLSCLAAGSYVLGVAAKDGSIFRQVFVIAK